MPKNMAWLLDTTRRILYYIFLPLAAVYWAIKLSVVFVWLFLTERRPR